MLPQYVILRADCHLMERDPRKLGTQPINSVDASKKCHAWTTMVGCVAQLAERRSLAGELTLSCARPSADG